MKCDVIKSLDQIAVAHQRSITESPNQNPTYRVTSKPMTADALFYRRTWDSFIQLSSSIDTGLVEAYRRGRPLIPSVDRNTMYRQYVIRKLTLKCHIMLRFMSCSIGLLMTSFLTFLSLLDSIVKRGQEIKSSVNNTMARRNR